jgi:hypothetical protein
VARLFDARGRLFDYPLQGTGSSPSQDGWTFLVAALDRPGFGPGVRSGPPAQPLRFVALYLRTRATQQTETQSTSFAALQTTADPSLRTGASGFAAGTPLDDFGDPTRYESVQTVAGAGSDTVSRSTEQFGGRSALQLSWSRGQIDAGAHGLRLRGDGRPLLVFADSGFLREAGLHTGSRVQMSLDHVPVSVQIAGEFSYFPSFSADGTHHLLFTDLSRLQAEVVRTPGLPDTAAPNEVWAAGGGAATATQQRLQRAGISAVTVLSLPAIQAGQQRDPLVAASWEGILFLSFAAILLLSALGFAVYSYLTAQSRSLEFAVLRTLGLSQGQIAALVGFEQMFVVGMGVIAGTVLGLPLSRVMIGYMGISETGQKVVPPLVGSVSWQAAAATYAGIAVVLVAAVMALVLLYGRLSVSRALRMGEV